MVKDLKDNQRNTDQFIMKFNELENRIKTLETENINLKSRVTTIENYFIGAITNNNHYISSVAGTYTGKTLTIKNGLITNIQT